MTTALLSADKGYRFEPIKIGPSWRTDESGRWVLPELTLGWHALAWTRLYLQHSAGKPWRYTNEQARLTLWWYAVDANGEWLFDQGVLQRLKGWGKDPVLATWSAVEFVGPSRPTGELARAGNLLGIPEGQPLGAPHPDAWIQVAAVSQQQTKNTMRLFPGLFTKRAKEEFQLDIGKEVVYAHKGAQLIEAVTSSPATLEGARATFVVKNETHHWTASNSGHDMADVIERNAAKSADGSARYLSITNAYEDGQDSVAERERTAYELVESGRSLASRILYDSLEAPPEAPLSAEAAPAVVDAIRGDSVWLNKSRIVRSILDPKNPPGRSRRYWYNQINAAEDAWLAPHLWDACGDFDRVLLDGDEIVMFFDGSKSDDATGLVAARVADGYVGTLGVWQRPPGLDPKAVWNVPRDEVNAVVDDVFERYKVLAFFADPGSGEDDQGERYWDRYIDAWAERYGAKLMLHAVKVGPGRHAVMWDMRSPARQEQFTTACERTASDVLERQLAHDGHKVLRQHVVNARRRVNRWGVSIGKEHRESKRKIDLAVCTVGARMMRRMLLNSHEWQKRSRSSGKGRVIVLR
ncbi:hypothetical protein [Sphaerisporangium sp. TRM90804]|uniref:hypothetical protein n=1 Tax=Sphaerisporangium sp. TRM90804 TaxID=3031113 RepID=UPI002449DD58|nr:hypothetical protein [Sphaerisporangium sp. TRM90804]MDH2424745.1 hypothetical protein [Sphaerisporangium sp. TRM90804]